MMNNIKIEIVKLALKELYTKDIDIIKKDLCERCLVHRLAVYLEMNPNLKGYNVDCEFNKSFYEDKVSNKILSNIHGNYVDIIVHKRSNILGENLMCFEIKKSKNTKDFKKDRENLKILTDENRFSYTIGFYIKLGKSLEKTSLEVYLGGSYFGNF